jgi:hypothetical protein
VIKLTPAELTKLDQLQTQFIQSIVGEDLPVDLEVFLRTEFGKFMGDAIDKYQTASMTANNCNGATVYN